MDEPKRIQTYEEFWKFYVSEHSDVRNRRLHFVGTCLTLIVFVLALAVSPWLLLLMPLAGYSFAWAGHFRFEKNRPATFKYPFWSLLSDFKMFGYVLAGRMDAEVAKYGNDASLTPPSE